MRSFDFQRPGSVADVAAALADAPDAKLLAGGQSLIPLLKLGLAEVETLISLAHVEELRAIRRDGDVLVIGATASHAQVAASDTVQAAIPALARMAAEIGDPQVRHRGTLGGSVAHADPSADYPAALLALGAEVETDRRRVADDELFRGPLATCLESDELLTAVRFPIPECSAYAKLPSPASRFALAGVMVARGRGGVRVAVTGAGASVFRAAEMEAALAADFRPEAIEAITVSPDDLMSDVEASAEYRAHLVGVMARRAVAGCT